MATPNKYAHFILVEFTNLKNQNQKQENQKLSKLVGKTSILKNPDENDRDFRARVFCEQFHKLSPDSSICEYVCDFITNLVIPSLVDEFERLPELQEKLMERLLALAGDDQEKFVSMVKEDQELEDDESEDDFKIRLYSEMFLKLPFESRFEMADYARFAAERYQQNYSRFPVKTLQISEQQPSGINSSLVRTQGPPPSPPPPPPGSSS